MHEIIATTVGGGRRVTVTPRPSKGWLAGGSAFIVVYVVLLSVMLVAISAGGLWVSLGALVGFVVALAGIVVPWAAFVVAWIATGSEQVTVAHGVITIETSVLGLGRTRHYALADARDVRVEPRVGVNRRIVAAYAYDRGAVAFDYGARSVRFGRRLSMREAEQVVEALEPALGEASGRRPARGDLEAPMPPRYRSRSGPEGVTVTMPFGNSPETLSMLTFVVLGLVPMVLVMPLTLSASLAEIGASSPMVFVSIAGITVLTMLMVVGVTLLPREVATVRGGVLEARVAPTGVAWIPSRTYDVSYIHNVRRLPPEPPEDATGMWVDYFKQQTGQVAFGYGPEQHRLGVQIDAPEARMIATEIETALAAQPGYGACAWEAYQRGLAASEAAESDAEHEPDVAAPLPAPPTLPPHAR
jgi:hypothetical protein